MLLLATTSDVLRLVTAAAVTAITVSVSWVDLNVSTGAITPGGDVQAITGAATTTIVPAPGSGIIRNIKGLVIANTNNATTNAVTLEHYDGTDAAAIVPIVDLQAGERIVFGEDGRWEHLDVYGAPYIWQGSRRPLLGPTGIFAETMDRHLANANNAVAASGTLFMQAIYLFAGQTVSNITLFSGTTAAATTTHLWFALYDANRNLLASSADQGAYTWALGTKKSLAMSTPYKVTASGLYYVGLLQIATTIASMMGAPAKVSTVLAGEAPILCGTSSTGLSALPNPAGGIATSTTSLYACVS